MSQSDNGVDVDGLGKSFGSVHALRDITFHVARGEVVALLGPNGAGKTTTIEMIEGLQEADEGEIEVLGLPWKSSATRRSRTPRMFTTDSALVSKAAALQR
mgnify:CR=1 FL=1